MVFYVNLMNLHVSLTPNPDQLYIRNKHKQINIINPALFLIYNWTGLVVKDDCTLGRLFTCK